MGKVVVNRTFRQEMARPENSREWQSAAMREGRAAIARNAPRRFGTLGDTLFTRVEYNGSGTTVIFASTRPYAKWQEAGTGIYGPMKRYITPKRANFLRWVDTKGSPGMPGGPEPLGPVRYAKRVKGSPPTLFMYRGLMEVFGNATSYAATGGKTGV